MKMAAINDKEQQKSCCEGETGLELIKEILNDIQNFKAQHEARKHEFQAKYKRLKINQAMQLEAQQTEQNEINIQIPQKINALNNKGKSICVVEADGKDICCICTRNSACKTRLCRCRTNRKLCTSDCRCRKNPGAEKSLRRQRKKKEKERLGRRRWEAEHFVKISNYFPTPARPLQLLWKGISEDMSLEFYLVTHDDVGGIACRRVGDSAEPFSGYSPVFWTSNTTFLESPFSKEEHAIYSMREHIGSVGSVHCNMDRGFVSRFLCINCSYDLVLPDLACSSVDPRNVEGRIWEYEDGTFGFGFLRNNFIIDLKHNALDGYVLDNVESSHSTHHVV